MMTIFDYICINLYNCVIIPSQYIQYGFHIMAYDKTMDGEDESIEFNAWSDAQSKEHPQLCYWATMLKLELTVLQLLRSLQFLVCRHREQTHPMVLHPGSRP
jgi:hypothetical protein